MSAEHPFSDPVFYPLRDPAQAGCVNGNPGRKQSGQEACRNPTRHGFPAMDMIAPLDTPVYAAGAGIVHPVKRSPDCIPAGGGEHEGQLVWIDHGGGVVSRYHHLNTITSDLQEGDLVAAGAQIGTMGHSGLYCGDAGTRDFEYLHFAIRWGGFTGERGDLGFGQKDNRVGSLYACVKGERRVWPSAISDKLETWNHIEYHQFVTPQSDGTCIPAEPDTPRPPQIYGGEAGDQTATITWEGAADAKADKVRIEMQEFRPTLDDFGKGYWRDFPVTASKAVFRKLVNGHAHRFRIQFHNGVGFSATTPWIELTPLGSPTTPGGPRWLRGDRDRIEYAWTKSYQDGSPVTGYEVSLRQKSGAGWSDWTFNSVPLGAGLHYVWRDMDHTKSYEARVRATSTVGPSNWLGPNGLKPW